MDIKINNMKLIANNFRGVLSNGVKYKIDVVYNGETSFITAYLKLYENGIYWVDGIQSSIVSDGYKTYTEALTEVLIKLENEYDLQLIRLELKTA